MIDQRLTKNLYRVDEACASLRKAIRGARYNDALAWVEELFISYCIGEVNVILFEMWIFLVGHEDIGWLKRWYTCDQSLTTIQKTTVSLIHTINERKHGELIVALTGTSLPQNISELYNSADFYHIIATHNNNTAPHFIKILKKLEKSPWYPYRSAVRMCISIAICKGVKVRPYKDIDLGIFTATPLEELKVSHLNIYGFSDRGRMKMSEDTLSEIRGDIVGTLMKKGCTYWQEALVGYDPDSPDEFYMKYFPDDIPDEWSLAKQERTHGKGSLFETEDGASLVKFCRGFFAGLEVGNISSKKIKGSTLFEYFC